jgi:hypothetical protein
MKVRQNRVIWQEVFLDSALQPVFGSWSLKG